MVPRSKPRRPPPSPSNAALFTGLTEPEAVPAAGSPLAARMRPRDLDEYVGQAHLVGPGRILRRAIDAGQLPSMVFWGPPGTGKTTLAAIAARRAKARFRPLSVVASGVADLRRIIEEARELRIATGERTVLFIDEIHRFNKAQQDAVLPSVESGDVILIGATTENPSFEVISALLSRSRVFTLKPLTEDDVRAIVRRSLVDERGLAGTVRLDEDAEDALVVISNGDARVALNTLELAADASPDAHVTLAAVKDAPQRRSLVYDRQGDAHYDTIRVHQERPRVRSGRLAVLAHAHDRLRRGPAVHRAPTRHPRGGGHRPRRPAGTRPRLERAAGRPPHRDARGLLPAGGGDRVPGTRAEVRLDQARAVRSTTTSRTRGPTPCRSIFGTRRRSS